MNEKLLEALTIIEEEHNRTKRDIEIIRQAKQEIERLNNIINELEKWLNNEITKQKIADLTNNCEWLGYGFYCTVLDKLQELIGSDKE